MITKLLHVQPSELKFPCSQVQLNKLSTCWLQLTNKTEQNVAFKVKTTHPRKYCVRPNVGIVSPGSTRVIRVSMQAQKENVLASVPKDKFLIQSMTAPVGLNAEDLTSEMFRKERGSSLEELMLRVVYVAANPPSPIPEVSEEEFSPEASVQPKPKRRNHFNELLDSAQTSDGDFQDQLSEASTWAEDFQDQWAEVSTCAGDFEDQFLEVSMCALESEDQPTQDLVSKLAEEKSSAVIENEKLEQELWMARKQIVKRSRTNVISNLVLLLACFVGFLFGYAFK